MSRISAATVFAAIVVSAAAAAAANVPSPGPRCNLTGVGARAVQFRATDGVKLDGAMLGKGATGVVLAHELAADLCHWLPYGKTLAAAGFRVLAFDLRCFGYSGCPSSAAARGRVLADVLGAAAELRRRGARRIALGGASLGGSAVLVAAAGLRPAPVAVVSLSGPTAATLSGSGYALDPEAAVRQVRAPLLLIAARGDGDFAADARTLNQAAASPVTKLVLVGGYAHGTAMLASARVRTTILAFLRVHA